MELGTKDGAVGWDGISLGNSSTASSNFRFLGIVLSKEASRMTYQLSVVNFYSMSTSTKCRPDEHCF
uniref:Uncharacterized protein n=1 Tax=Romanomermis culicivorax TaxID=13658 RepID=A0A915I057_ROMCU